MKKIIILLIICVVITIIPLMAIKDSEFGGSDDAAEELISEVDPDYEPWAESLLEPPGDETESFLFALQAAIGAGIVGYVFGYYNARKKHETENKKELAK